MKLLACDFDGTLYQKQKISTTDQKSIRNWQKQGNLFVFATGRDIFSIQSKLKHYQLKPDHIIGCNGATVNQQILSTLDSVLAWELLGQIKQAQFPFQQIKISSVHYLTAKSLTKTFIPTFDWQELLVTVEQAAITQLSIQTASPQSAQHFTSTYEQLYPQMMFFQNSQTVDIVAAKTDKARALKHLVQQLQLAPHHIFTIGDGLNDLQMLKQFQSASFPWVTSSVFQAADTHVQSVSDWITCIS